MFVLIKNIKNMMKTPAIILLLIAMSSVALTIIGLSYGIIMTVQDNRNEQTIMNKLYGVDLQIKFDIDEFDEKITPLLDMIGDELDYMYCGGVVDNTTLAMIRCGSNSDYSGTVFTYEQLYNNEKVADAHYKSTGNKVGDTVNIGGTDFTIKYTDENVVEDGELYSDYRIPYGTAPKGVKIHEFKLILRSMPSERVNDEIQNYITKNFQPRELAPPQIIDAETEQRRSFSLTACIAMALILCFCLSYVYLYIIQKRKNQMIILIMCGCEPEKANKIFTLEILIYAAIGCVLSIPCLFPAIKVFDKIYIDFSAAYDLSVFLILIIGYLLLTALMLTSFLRPFIKSSVSELQKGGI